MPAWISSTMSSAPVELARARASAKNSCDERANAAFALDGFNEDGADLVGELGAQIGNVVEADELDAGNDGRKGLAILSL